MKRLEILLAIALSIAMITACGKTASENSTGQTASGGESEQAATESSEKEELWRAAGGNQ